MDVKTLLRRIKSRNKHTFLDLFAGCGGATLGRFRLPNRRES